MRFHAFHGVIQQERLTGGDFAVSVEATCQLLKAAQTDDVAHTLNYAEIYAIVEQEMRQPSKLIENVAARIGEKLMEAMPQMEELTVSVTKLNPPMGADCDGATVQLHWTNDGND